MRRKRRPGAASRGFSLVEVLVTVALVASAMTAIMGVARRQVRTTALLRTHAEARGLLAQTASRFQCGYGCPSDTLIQGQFAEYRLSSAAEPAQSAEPPLGSGGPAGRRGADASDPLKDSAMVHKRIEIRWQDIDRERSIAVDAWRFEPEGGVGEGTSR